MNCRKSLIKDHNEPAAAGLTPTQGAATAVIIDFLYRPDSFNSARISRTALFGSAARVTWRPITKWLAPSTIACAGVATRF